VIPVPKPLVSTSLTSPQYHHFTITQLKTTEDIQTHSQGLSLLLQACVNEGTSLGFLAPLSVPSAQEYWTSLESLITSPKSNLYLFILTSPTSSSPSQILGTVQLFSISKHTHSHRGEVQKLLVLPDARKLGIARQLMRHVEDFARELGKEVLVLDTATLSPAREMYTRLGWEEWGTCKAYASWTDGSKCDATFFRKDCR
jgi:ribosomal protein S18 acetylase RimI-like enzyme